MEVKRDRAKNQRILLFHFIQACAKLHSLIYYILLLLLPLFTNEDEIIENGKQGKRQFRKLITN